MSTTVTIIHSNGGGLAGPIEALFDRLETATLDRTFEDERFGGFASIHDERPEMTAFFGNFFDYSHVFNIETNDPDLIARLTAAIEKNKLRPDYLAQQTYEERKTEEAAREDARRAAKIEQEKQRARIVLGVEARS